MAARDGVITFSSATGTASTSFRRTSERGLSWNVPSAQHDENRCDANLDIAHWYPRFRSTLGMFDYDQRGILDATCLRFFTRRSITKLIERQGWSVRRVEPVGLPLDALGVEGGRAHAVRLADQVLLSSWPTVFGYQFIVEAAPRTAA